MQYSFVPELFFRPNPANQFAPRLQIVGATATVSTLATVVGHPNNPTSAGKGGFKRGFPCFPSILSMSSFFATDVGPSTAMNANVKWITRATSVLAYESWSIGLINGLLNVRGLLIEFSADVYVCCSCVHATRHPSMSLWGSPRRISRSLHVPGSPLSALITRYRGLHQCEVGKSTRRASDLTEDLFPRQICS